MHVSYFCNDSKHVRALQPSPVPPFEFFDQYQRLGHALWTHSVSLFMRCAGVIATMISGMMYDKSEEEQLPYALALLDIIAAGIEVGVVVPAKISQILEGALGTTILDLAYEAHANDTQDRDHRPEAVSALSASRDEQSHELDGIFVHDPSHPLAEEISQGTSSSFSTWARTFLCAPFISRSDIIDIANLEGQDLVRSIISEMGALRLSFEGGDISIFSMPGVVGKSTFQIRFAAQSLNGAGRLLKHLDSKIELRPLDDERGQRIAFFAWQEKKEGSSGLGIKAYLDLSGAGIIHLEL